MELVTVSELICNNSSVFEPPHSHLGLFLHIGTWQIVQPEEDSPVGSLGWMKYSYRKVNGKTEEGMCTWRKVGRLLGVAGGKSQANCMAPLWETGWKKKQRKACCPGVREIITKPIMLKEITGDEKRKNTWYFIKQLPASPVLPKSFYMNNDYLEFLIRLLKKIGLWG